MPVYAVGDIQGCYEEFQSLLEQLRFDPSRDRLWLVGDLVNRGPKSLEVLRAVKQLGAAAVVVLGNHDLHLLALALVPGQRPKAKDTLQPILDAPDRDELLDWLRHQPVLHHDVTLDYTMIHAGLPPQWDLEQAQACARELEHALRDPDLSTALFENMYGDQPDCWSDELQGFARLRFITNSLTRLRFCRADGRMQLKYKGTIDQAPDDVMPWFRVPARRSRGLNIVCGHWSALGFHAEDNVLSIDTGCVWGQQLCAVRLDAEAQPVCVSCTSSGLAPEDG